MHSHDLEQLINIIHVVVPLRCQFWDGKEIMGAQKSTEGGKFEIMHHKLSTPKFIPEMNKLSSHGTDPRALSDFWQTRITARD